MALVYIAENLKVENIAQIEKYKNRLEQYSDKNALESLNNDKAPNGLIFRRRLANSLRLIIQKKFVNEKYIFVLRNIIKREDYTEYNEFWTEREKWLQHNPLSDIDNENISKLTQKPPTVKLPDIDDNYIHWITRPKMEFEFSIFESKSWLDKNENFKTYWQDYYDLILSIVNNENENITSYDDKWIKLVSSSDCKKHIMYQLITTKESENLYFLFDYFYGDKPTDDMILIGLEKYYTKKGFLNKDTMLPNARRAYPDYLLSDKGEWQKIQNNTIDTIDLANLALSGEEMQILTESKFPMFINGHAGSGKSTIILYLFSGYLKKYHKNQKDHWPLFLTYNKKLLSESKKLVSKILNYNEHLRIDASDIDNLVDKSMFAFQNFILNKLFNKPMRFKFKKGISKDGIPYHINFSLFKKLYNNDKNHPANIRYMGISNVSATAAWHVIRSIIKGHKIICEVKPENYLKDVQKKDRTVSEEVFKDIYYNVYSNWYKKLVPSNPVDIEYWDDISLVRYAIEQIDNGVEFNKYPVIFCDEAQDFTPAEFQLLIFIQKLMDFDLSQQKVDLPIAFAGDHLQTINPTGFRWANLKATYHNVVKNTKIPKTSKVIYNAELCNNYRSSLGIVDLANWLQFYRYSFILDDINNFYPQEAWSKDHLPPLIFTDEVINKSKEEFKDNLKGSIIILPVDGSEEKDYCKNDDILKNFNYNEIKNNIFTPESIKGLEFDKIILYKYGQFCESNLNNLLIGKLDQLNEDEKIEISYFMNKLYVAITRARSNLYIYDSNDGINKLWINFMKKKYEQLSDSEGFIYKENFYGDVRVASVNQIQEIKIIDFRKYAQELEFKGLQQENSEFLQRAAYFYKKGSNFEKSYSCEAKSYEMECKWNEAATAWLNYNNFDYASHCFWKAQNWIKLKENEINMDRKKNHFYLFISKFMLTQTKELNSLNKYIFNESIKSNIKNTPIWQTVINKVISILDCQKLENVKDIGSYADEVSILFSKSKALFKKDSQNTIAKYYFYTKRYRDAIQYWNYANIKHDDYYWSKYFIEYSDKQKISLLMKLKPSCNMNKIVAKDEIISLCAQFSTEESIVKLVGNYFYKYKHYDLAIEYWSILLLEQTKDFKYAKYKLSEANHEKLYWLLEYNEISLRKTVFETWAKVVNNDNELNSFLSLGNSYRMVNLLKKSKLLKNKEIYKLIKKLETPYDWIEMIRLNNQNVKVKKSKNEIISAIANSEILKDDFETIINETRSLDRIELIEFVKNEFVLLESLDLERISIKELIQKSISYEKVIKFPNFHLLLTTYEHILNRKDLTKQTLNFIRKRWLAVKLSKLNWDYENKKLSNKDEIKIVEKEEQLNLQKKGWGIKENINDFMFPFKQRSKHYLFNEIIKHSKTILNGNSFNEVSQLIDHLKTNEMDKFTSNLFLGKLVEIIENTKNRELIKFSSKLKELLNANL